MRTPIPWRKEFWSVFAGLTASGLFGAIYGVGIELLILGGAAYLGWQIYNLVVLVRWLDGSGAAPSPDTPGLWGVVYYRLEIRRRKDEQRKRQIKKFLKEFSNSAQALPDATVVLDRHWDIQWINEAAIELLGLRKGDTGQPIFNLIRTPEFSSYVAKEHFDTPLEIPSPGNPERLLSLTIVSYGKNRYLLLARDQTEQKQLDQMRRDFIANASHELRTPLTVLHGTIEQLESVAKSIPELGRPLGWMQRQSERMRRILEDLLKLARLEDPKAWSRMEEIESPAAMIDKVRRDAELVSQRAGGHTLEMDVDPSISVYGMEEILYAAFSNLVMNAVRYTPPGGRISVSWNRVPAGARFQVSDTGPGILLQHLPRLTERFYRVDVGRSRETGGTGLGLSIVRHVLEKYRTNLEVRSVYGSGSTFSFTIPAEFLVDVESSREVAS